MSNVIHINENLDIPETLRSIAAAIECGEIKTDLVTLIAVPEVYQIGVFNDETAALEAIFACNYAIHKLLNATMED